MKKILSLSALICSFSFCNAQTQLQLDEDAGAKYKSADLKLNILYKKILKDYADDTAFIKQMKATQRIWIQFRDAQLKMKYPDMSGDSYGSVLPMCEAIYLQELTEDRIKTLQEWDDGIQEGDVCAGSVKIKN